MAIFEAIRAALSNLGLHKLRTFLTMLGMIFGVAAVLSMLAIGAGAEDEALSTIQKMGIRNIQIKAKEFEPDELRIIRQDSEGLSLRDASALRAALPPDSLIVGRKNLRTYQILSSLGRTDSRVIGVNADFPTVAGLGLVEGSFFARIDEDLTHQVCVLGTTARRRLFGLEEAIGEHIKINQEWFVVMGVLEDRQLSQEEFEGVKLENPNNDIYVPLRTLLNKFERDPVEDELDEIVIRIPEQASLREQADLVSSMMASMHNQLDDFTLIVPERLLEQSRRTQRIFNIVMGTIASISLLVGGIGIMNIMLASVLERTNEIGLRRAVGATRRDISRQFILESVAIGCSGAALGIVLGFGLAFLVAAYSGWSTIITPLSVILSVGVSLAVCFAFGFYPARKAALVSPIEALRYE